MTTKQYALIAYSHKHNSLNEGYRILATDMSETSFFFYSLDKLRKNPCFYTSYSILTSFSSFNEYMQAYNTKGNTAKVLAVSSNPDFHTSHPELFI
jgi:hypothetical protein